MKNKIPPASQISRDFHFRSFIAGNPLNPTGDFLGWRVVCATASYDVIAWTINIFNAKKSVENAALVKTFNFIARKRAVVNANIVNKTFIVVSINTRNPAEF